MILIFSLMLNDIQYLDLDKRLQWASCPFLISILHEAGGFQVSLDAHHYAMNTAYNAFSIFIPVFVLSWAAVFHTLDGCRVGEIRLSHRCREIWLVITVYQG